MARGPHGQEIKLGADKSVWLTLADVSVLRQVATGAVEVKTIERNYRRLASMGLVQHRFTTDEDWPRALAELTPLGTRALDQAALAA